MATNDTDPTGLPAPEVIEFTTPVSARPAAVRTPVVLCGEEFTARRPKDAVLFFTQSAMADVANDSDRALAMLQLLDACLQPVDRHRILQRACDPDDPVTAGAVYGMIHQLLERWDPATKIPDSAPVLVAPVPDSAPANDPVRIVNDDLGLDLLCRPPKDLILHITASALATNANAGQQAWCVMLFLDAALSNADALQLEARIRNPRDELDLEALLNLIHTLMGRWHPESMPPEQPNRKQRRARAAQGRKKSSARTPGKAAVAPVGKADPLPAQDSAETTPGQMPLPMSEDQDG